MPSRKDGPPSIWGTHMVFWETFWQIQPRPSFATLPAGFESMEFSYVGTNSLINGGKEWESITSFRIRDARARIGSQKFSHPLWGEILQRIKGQTNNDCRFQILIRSWFRLIPYTSNVSLLEDEIQDWGMFLFTISYGSYAVDQRSGVGWFSGWFKIFVICKRNSNAEFWSSRCENCFSTEQNHP